LLQNVHVILKLYSKYPPLKSFLDFATFSMAPKEKIKGGTKGKG
jgi:hypothetical protein